MKIDSVKITFISILTIATSAFPVLTLPEEEAAIAIFHAQLFTKKHQDFEADKLDAALEQLPELTHNNPYIKQVERAVKHKKRPPTKKLVTINMLLSAGLWGTTKDAQRMLSKLGTPALRAQAILAPTHASNGKNLIDFLASHNPACHTLYISHLRSYLEETGLPLNR